MRNASDTLWPERFLAALETTGNVTGAAAIADINRWTAYERRKTDSAFAAAWDQALEVATDHLEAEARRRAIEGCERPVFYQGEECGRIREYSDTLMVVLLKAHRPQKFRENASVDITSGGQPIVFQVFDDGRDPDPNLPAPAAPA